MRLKVIAKGIATRVPGSSRFLSERGTGGTITAEYCYQVWLKHLLFLRHNGMDAIPSTLAELGPGDSIGTGLAAMLCGIDRYYALDVYAFAGTERNLAIFEQLVSLLEARTPQTTEGWPDVAPLLGGRIFPDDILTDERLAAALAPGRVEAIRQAIRRPGQACDGVTIAYMAPWNDPAVIEPESVDLVLSHAVLEHVADPVETYRTLARWMKRGARMTHQVDLGSHDMATAWNGHRACREWVWKLAMGRRAFFVNRMPCSEHLAAARDAGFRIDLEVKRMRTDGIARDRVAPAWRHLSDEDLGCSELFFQATKD